MSKQNTMDNAVIPLMSIWDAVNDLSRLRGIVAAVTYLTSPQHLKEDDEFEVFHEVFAHQRPVERSLRGPEVPQA